MGKLEAVARAIAREMGEADWKNCASAARAAVLALRESSVDMLDTAVSNVPDWGCLPDDWRRMID